MSITTSFLTKSQNLSDVIASDLHFVNYYINLPFPSYHDLNKFQVVTHFLYDY